MYPDLTRRLIKHNRWLARESIRKRQEAEERANAEFFERRRQMPKPHDPLRAWGLTADTAATRQVEDVRTIEAEWRKRVERESVELHLVAGEPIESRPEPLVYVYVPRRKRIGYLANSLAPASSSSRREPLDGRQIAARGELFHSTL